VSAVDRPVVLVLVGTDHHRFDRLIDWTDGWLAARTGVPVTCLVQHGTSRAPRLAEGRAYLGHEDVDRLMRSARVVVSHGGPTTISEARRHGHLPLVVPRRSASGEHVDDHQLRFTGRLARTGMIRLVDDEQQFATAVEGALALGPSGNGSASVLDATSAARSFGLLVEQLLVHR
jgi:UDP-N-acetylglucosamine transferase subunit ALG13